MIILNKLYTKDKQDFISFANEQGWEVSIPIDRWHFDRIKLYLENIAGTASVPFDFQEKEESEEDL